MSRQTDRIPTEAATHGRFPLTQLLTQLATFDSQKGRFETGRTGNRTPPAQPVDDIRRH